MITDAVPVIFLALFILIHIFSLFHYLVARVINIMTQGPLIAALPWGSEWQQILRIAEKLQLRHQWQLEPQANPP